MNKNFNAGKGINLAAGIVNILTGTTAIIYSLIMLFVALLAGSILGKAGAGAAAGVLGIIMIIPLAIYIGIGITLICFGASNCKTYKYQTKDYSMYRRGKKLRGVSTLSSVFETNEDTMLGSTIKAVCLSKYDDSFIVSIKDPRELGEIGQEAIREINKVNLSK